jgi:alkylation response protein AidB-like acyl-CoA dehydrogenase
MDAPGITVRPIGTMHGSPEFSELFLDDVAVSSSRTLGVEGGGWAVAMDLLPYERSTSLWHRAAFLHRRLEELVRTAPAAALDPARLGEVTQLLYAFRARSRATQYRMAAGDRLGPETSIDKVLLATAEQAVFDLAADALAADVATGDDPVSGRWRTEYLYSRAASIYGGSAEIQRNIIARRLLDLGDDR